MGGEGYWYIEKYEPDVDSVLQKLRKREFEAGRYNPVIPFPIDLFPIGPDSPAPGAKHASIDEAMEATEADGTRSILDLNHVSETPDFFAVSPLSDEVLKEIFGTTQPTRNMVEKNMDVWYRIERGQGIYIILYKDGQPDEIFFGGCSFD